MAAAAESAVQEELAAYLEDKGVNHLFIQMVEQLLLSKPEQPVAFLVEFLLKAFPEETRGFARTGAAGTGAGSAGAGAGASAAPAAGDDSDAEEEAEDADGFAELAELPVMKKKLQGNQAVGRRVSVSAGVINAAQAGRQKVVFAKTSQEKQRLTALVKGSVLCAHLDESELATIVDAFEKFTCKPSADIIRQGDRVAEHFYVLDKGHAMVFKNDKKLDVLYGPGDSFGEVALMYNAPRAATVRASPEPGGCVLWRLDQVTFKIILMGSAMKRREQNQQFLRTVPILQEMAESERMVLADALVERRFGKGEVIVKQGEAGDEFFIVAGGAVKVERDGKQVSTLGEGKYFGEVALLTSKPRQATVTATSDDVRLLAVHRKVFQRVLGPLGDILSRNMVEYEKWIL